MCVFSKIGKDKNKQRRVPISEKAFCNKELGRIMANKMARAFRLLLFLEQHSFFLTEEAYSHGGTREAWPNPLKRGDI